MWTDVTRQTRTWNDWADLNDTLCPYGDALKTSLIWIFSTNAEPIINVFKSFEPELKDGSSIEEAQWFEENVLQDYRRFSFQRELEAQARKISFRK